MFENQCHLQSSEELGNFAVSQMAVTTSNLDTQTDIKVQNINSPTKFALTICPLTGLA